MRECARDRADPYTGVFKRCFNRKIEPVFSVGTGDPGRSSYDLDIPWRSLKVNYSIDIAFFKGRDIGTCHVC